MTTDTGKPDELGAMAYWMDHRGKLIGPGPVDNPTGWEKYADRTHRIMRPQPGQRLQAISWCGRRVHEVPGHGPVDCPELSGIARRGSPPDPRDPSVHMTGRR